MNQCDQFNTLNDQKLTQYYTVILTQHYDPLIFIKQFVIGKNSATFTLLDRPPDMIRANSLAASFFSATFKIFIACCHGLLLSANCWAIKAVIVTMTVSQRLLSISSPASAQKTHVLSTVVLSEDTLSTCLKTTITEPAFQKWKSTQVLIEGQVMKKQQYDVFAVAVAKVITTLTRTT